MNLKMYLWVTSICNLSCPLCNQKHALDTHKGYSMDMDELRAFIKSCQDRNIHFSWIELTGGEITWWTNLEEGIKLLYDSKICDKITLATNGNNPEKIFNISSMLDYWVVSKTQATKEQVAQYQPYNHKINYNSAAHKPAPDKPLDNIIPATCCCSIDKYGAPYTAFLYIKNKVYYCHFTVALSQYVDIVKDDVVCDFTDDFVAKFSNKTYDKEICTYCLCNKKIWDKI